MDPGYNFLHGINRTQAEGVPAPHINGELSKGKIRMKTSGIILPFHYPDSVWQHLLTLCVP